MLFFLKLNCLNFKATKTCPISVSCIAHIDDKCDRIRPCNCVEAFSLRITALPATRANSVKPLVLVQQRGPPSHGMGWETGFGFTFDDNAARGAAVGRERGESCGAERGKEEGSYKEREEEGTCSVCVCAMLIKDTDMRSV